MELVDAAARERIRTSLDETLVVEAPAGTGKTSEIIKRITAVLASGAAVERIVALTFTVKAAGELKLGLRGAIDKARASAPAVEAHRLDEALRQLEQAHINTIHGFCDELLAEHVVAARVDPSFATLDDVARDRLYRQVFTDWLQRALEAPGPGLRRALHRLSAEREPTEHLLAAGRTMLEWRDFAASWRRDSFDRAAAIDGVLAALDTLYDLSALGSQGDPLHGSTAAARALRDEMGRRTDGRARDDDEMEALLVQRAADRDFIARPKAGRGAFYANDVPRQAVIDAHAVFLTTLATFARQANTDLAALLHGEIRATMAQFERAKGHLGRVDFLDMLLRARDVLRSDEAVRHDLQGRFSHIFIDEFQDTDVLQAEILVLLASKDASVSDWRKVRPVPGKLFVVGDPKQSIYRFRRADVTVYREVRDLLVVGGATLLHLETNFRSVPAIQGLVNVAFAPLMRDDEKNQSAYVPLRPYRQGTPGQPAVVALPIPQPFGPSQQPTKAHSRKSQPQAVAEFLSWLIRSSGWTVVDRDGTQVSIAPHHVCILFKQFVDYRADLTRPYVDALEARELPHLLVGGRALHGREEVGTMRAALRAIEDPSDDLALYATLRGSLFGINDLTLFEYRSRQGQISAFHIPEVLSDRLHPVAGALRIILGLHRKRNGCPVAETIGRLLEETRAFAGFAFRPNGDQVLANVLLVLELARAYDAEGVLSFRAFVERLEDNADRREATEAPTLEEGSEGIRLMTVHKAKGLEFPVVVLADLATNVRQSRARRYVDRARDLCVFSVVNCDPAELLENATAELAQEEAETIRLLYVAATRARDLLVVPTIGDRVWRDKWIKPLCAAVHPRLDARAESAPGCPAFGDSTVIGRGGGSRPGRYCSAVGADRLDVTWWDPQLVEKTLTPSLGIRAKALLDAPEDADVVRLDVAAFEAWERDRQATLQAAAAPSVVVQAVTQLAYSVGRPESVLLVDLGYGGQRGSGARFGTLVHEVLATIPLSASAEEVENYCTLHGRRLGSTPEERNAATSLVISALEHAILRGAAAAEARGECHREAPVTLQRPDGTIIEGVVDLAYYADGVWWVIDFKTDTEIASGTDAYKAQVGTYASAVAAATAQECRGVLFKL